MIGAAMDIHREFVCYETIVVGTKAISKLTSADEAELINELKSTRLHRGLLPNFGGASLEHKRLVFGPSENVCQPAKSVDEPYL